MAGLISLLSAQLQIPQGLGVWEDIIRWFYSGIGDYGFTIILIAIILKVLMLPIDYFQRKASAKQMAQQERIAPQIAKLKEKYANDKNTLNQKTMELYKREGIGFGSCGIMLLYMFVTCFVFITLFAGMNNISSNVVKSQYNELRTTYKSVEQNTGESAEDFQKRQEQAVFEKYNEIKTSWLWIENIWRPDTTGSPIASFESYANSAKLKNKTDEEKAIYQAEKEEYEKIMNPLRAKVRSANGYYILIILAAAVTFLSMTLSQSSLGKKKKKENKQQQDEGRIMSAKGEREKPQEKVSGAPAMKIMKWILPIVMILITLGYSAAFAIYIVTISAFGALANYIFNLILKNKKDDLSKPTGKSRVEVKKPDYVRQ